MSGKGKTRQRLILIIRYLQENTEPGKRININDMQEYLSELSSNRTIIYEDLKALETMGAGVNHTKNNHYYYDPQGFTYGELSLLADVICSSSYLSAKKAEELILHIKQMTNMKKFDDLSKDIDVVLRNKTLNEECINNIDVIHDAIRNNKQISFNYAKYDDRGQLWYGTKNGDKFEKVYVESGNREQSDVTQTIYRTLSPYKLLWDNSQCYLISGYRHYDSFSLCNFRVDRIFGLRVLSEPRIMPDTDCDFYDSEKNDIDAEKYLKSTFFMFNSNDGKLTDVKFLITKNLAGVMIDKFGSDIEFYEYDDNHFWFRTQIQKSNNFFGWAAMFSHDKFKILEPPGLAEEFKAHLKEIIGEG